VLEDCWFEAAGHGRLNDIKRLLKRGIKVGKATNEGVTPFYAASVTGHLKIVKYLVEEGKAEVDKADNEGGTAVDLAKHRGHEEIFTYLKGKGAKE